MRRWALTCCLMSALAGGSESWRPAQAKPPRRRVAAKRPPPRLPQPRRQPTAEQIERNRVLAALLHQDPKHRADAAWKAGDLRLQRAYGTLRRLLRDRHPYVRRNAAYALGCLGRNEAVLPLYDRIIREREPEVVAQLAIALGRLRYRTARPLLLSLTWRSSRVLQTAGAIAVGHLGDPDDVSSLARFARQSDPGLRRTAATALGLLGTRRALPLLRRLLGDPSDAVQVAAVNAIVALRASSESAHMAKLLDTASDPVRLVVVDGLAQLRVLSALPKLRPLMGHPNQQVAARTALAVARLGGEVPLDKLIALIHSPNNAVRVPAVETAGLAGIRRAIPALVTLIEHHHPELKMAAIRALGQLVAYQTVEALVARLSHEQGALRAALLTALGKLRATRYLAAVLPLMDDADPRVAAAATWALGQFARLDSRPIRAHALRLLGALRPDRPMTVLRAAVDAYSVLSPKKPRLGFVRLVRLTLHPSAEVRGIALRALGRYGDRSADPVVLRLFNDPNPLVSAEAAVAAARLRLRDGRFRIRMRVASMSWALPDVIRGRWLLALALIDPSARKSLTRLAKRIFESGPNSEEKAEFLSLLAEVGGRWAMPTVQAALRSPCYLVRAAARRALSIWPPSIKAVAGLTQPPTQAATKAKPPKRRPHDRDASSPDDTPAGPFASPTAEPGCGCSAPARDPSPWRLAIILALFLLGRIITRNLSRIARAVTMRQP